MSQRIAIGIAVVLAVIAGVVIWRLMPRQRTFYTDADTIRTPVESAQRRDILWQPPIALPDALVNTGSDDYEPRMSWDGLTLYFVRGKAGENADIYSVNRTTDGWTDPTPVEAVNSEYDDLGATPSYDGTALYFYSNRPGSLGGYDLWVANLGPNGWRAPTNLGPAVNSPYNDYGPALAPNGDTLYFSSNRPASGEQDQTDTGAWPATIREDRFTRDYDLYTATITAAGPGPAAAIESLNTPSNEGAPAVSSFGDFLYFASDRTGGHGGFDIYRARRNGDSLQEPQNLGTALNSPANELDPGLTMGGFALYFSSDRLTSPPKAEHAGQPPDYNLYLSQSREVFTEIEYLDRPFNWAAFWQQLGPNLLLALLALLALLFLLWYLSRGMRYRRLSLLTKCLLASLLVHLLLMLLFNTWGVTATLAGMMRGRSEVRVALAPNTNSGDIFVQVRGNLTDFEPVESPQFNPMRATTQLEAPPAPTPAAIEVPRGPIQPQALVELNRQTPPEAEPSESPPDVAISNTVTAPRPESAQIELPAESTPTRYPESDANSPTQVAAKPPALRREIANEAVIQTGQTEPFEVNPAAIPIPVESSAESLADAIPAADVELDANSTTATSIDLSTTVQATKATLDLSLPSANQPDAAIAEQAPPTIETPQLTPPRSDSVVPSPSAAPSPMHELQPAMARLVSAESLIAVSQAIPAEAQPVSSPATAVPTLDTQALAATAAQPSDLPLPTMEVAEPAEQTHNEANPSMPAPPVAWESLQAPAVVESMSPASRSVAVNPARPQRQPDVNSLYAAMAVPETALSDALPDLLEPNAKIVEPQAGFGLNLDLRLPTEMAPPENPYAQRAKEDRLNLVERLGGSEETEKAVAASLEWLARHQSPDGRWDSDGFDTGCGECGGQTNISVDIAVTGLSLLCFLAADHTHTKDGPYRETVASGLDWLLSQQKSDGDLRGDIETMYSHGIATIALSEALGMTKDDRLATPSAKAVRFIDSARNRDVGGWRYDPQQPGDTSVLGWQIMALKSASLAGVEIPVAAMQEGRQWLKKVSPSTGLYAYQPHRKPTPSMTAEGMFVQQLLGVGRDDPAMAESVQFFADDLPDWDGLINTYFWYYGTLALFQHQGPAWNRWNQAMTRELVDHQRTDGRAAGSWDPIGEWAPTGGRVYQTAICTLMLEVYYRYLPLYSFEQPDSDEPGTLRGLVTDASTGQPLPGAHVQLDRAGQDPLVVEVDADGRYVLRPAQVPDHFAVSASHPGYSPESANVAGVDLRIGRARLDFNLQPTTQNVVALEATPDVHHLGNDAFEGAINSQFQKNAEGRTFEAPFDLTPAQLTQADTAELSLLTKGVQCPHRIFINDALLETNLAESPPDGSFGEFTVQFDANVLQPGANTVRIRAVSCHGDLDDFEFVNLKIRLLP